MFCSSRMQIVSVLLCTAKHCLGKMFYDSCWFTKQHGNGELAIVLRFSSKLFNLKFLQASERNNSSHVDQRIGPAFSIIYYAYYTIYQ